MTSAKLATTTTERPATLKKDESNGFISTIITAAHNAANMIESINKEEKRKGHAGNLAELVAPNAALGSTNTLGTQVSIHSSNSELTSPVATNVTDPLQTLMELSTSNVHFEPVHDSPVSTMGNGDLLLLHFDKKKGKRSSVDSASKMSALGGAGPDASNRLSISGDHDTQIVRRKSMSNVSTVDSNDGAAGSSDHDDNASTESNETESNQKLDQILDSAAITPASKKKNREFHHVFRKIPSSEKLIYDFSCALSKDILVQGKMYLSEHYICFNSNILGWVTNITIPLREVLQIEKKSTAVLFPNGMVIRTLHQRYVFATFLSRDATFNIITKIWHEALDKNNDEGGRRSRSGTVVRGRAATMDNDITSGGGSDESDLDEAVDTSSPVSGDERPAAVSRRLSMKPKKADVAGDDSLDELGLMVSDDDSSPKAKSPLGSEKESDLSSGLKNPGPKSHAPTKSNYSKESGDVDITETTFNAPLGAVYELLFGENAGPYIKILENMKNFDILKDKIVGISNSNKQRDYSYIKPLSGPIGPKQTKCLITDTVKFCDFSNYVEVEQVTATPDVPSGSSFKVKTRIFLTWGPGNTTNMFVVTNIEWSAKSWIKGAIEKGSIDGQKDSMKVMVDSLNDAISKGSGGATSKKRKKAKTISSPTPASKPVEVAPPKELTVVAQIEKLAESIGEGSPVKIPMVSATVTGIIIIVLFSFMYTYCLMKLAGTGGHGPSIQISTQDSFTKMIKLNDKSYYVFPSPDTYMSDEMNRKINEGNVWKWINDRSGGNLKAAHLSQGSPYSQFADQEFEEVVKLAKQRIDQLYKQLES